MGKVRVVFLGTGDAFSAGGSLQASYLLQSPGITLLLDCGASILASFGRAGMSTDPVDAVLLSHLHGDHFAGLPFLLLEYVYVEPRRRPLPIVGPAGTKERVLALFEAMYPDALREVSFGLEFIEMVPGQPLQILSATVAPFAVTHQRIGTSLGLGIELDGRRIVYSGDTGWTEELITHSSKADLFICECSFYNTRIPSHLDYARLAENRHRFSARRIILTHLGREVQAMRSAIDAELAYDGLIVEL
jgi:ribonuclease BN (tRNA processing enzyme)